LDANQVLLRARSLNCDCLQNAASRLHNLQPQHAFFEPYKKTTPALLLLRVFVHGCDSTSLFAKFGIIFLSSLVAIVRLD